MDCGAYPIESPMWEGIQLQINAYNSEHIFFWPDLELIFKLFFFLLLKSTAVTTPCCQIGSFMASYHNKMPPFSSIIWSKVRTQTCLLNVFLFFEKTRKKYTESWINPVIVSLQMKKTKYVIVTIRSPSKIQSVLRY